MVSYSWRDVRRMEWLEPSSTDRIHTARPDNLAEHHRCGMGKLHMERGSRERHGFLQRPT